MSVRHPEKAMLDSWGAFDTAIKLSTLALIGKKTARYKNLSQLVHENFFKFDKDWRVFKADTIQKVTKTEEGFNEVKVDIETGDSVPSFPQNDSWAEHQMTRYSDTLERLEEGLGAVQESKEEKKVHGNVDLLVVIVKAEFTALEKDIERLRTDVEGLEDYTIPVLTKSIYDVQIQNLTSRMTEGLMEKINDIVVCGEDPSDSVYKKQSLLTKLESFINGQQDILSSCSSLLFKKVKLDFTVVETKPDLHNSQLAPNPFSKPREQVYLEKTKPPRFNGEDVDFPEFRRKWTSQVTKANLPTETEIDKLKDNLPKDAKEQLFGVKTLEEAWSILTKRFGDPMLISRKLKAQLKNIQSIGKNDPERVINIKIKVRNVVTRLEAMNMGEALKHDQEFLSAVYNALPDRHRKGWWEYPKDDNLWGCMLNYLDRIYEQSNGELLYCQSFPRQSLLGQVPRVSSLLVCQPELLGRLMRRKMRTLQG